MNNKKYKFKPRKEHLRMFSNKEEICNGYSNCCYIKRIMTALSYYNDLSVNTPDGFIEFCDKYYDKQYLEDYIHFICVHKNDINSIKKLHSDSCLNVNGCVCTGRHFRDKSSRHDDAKNESDALCIDIFDSIHFYIHHMEECGLRISINKDYIRNENDIKDNMHDIKHIRDERVALIQQEIENRAKKCGLYKRLNDTKNSKFNIMHNNYNINMTNICDAGQNDKQDGKNEVKPNNTNENSSKKGSKSVWKKIQSTVSQYFGKKNTKTKEKYVKEQTFMDYMLDDIGSVNKLREYLLVEEYDTDCIENDIDIYDDTGDCNLLR
eukprot:130917_1